MSFRVFNLTLLLFKYKLSQSCKQWQSRQLPRLGEAFGTSLLPQSTSPQPLNLLHGAGPSIKLLSCPSKWKNQN